MDYKKIKIWLQEHKITLQEGFSDTINQLSRKYKEENGFKKLDDVYKLIGVSKQNISYWKYNPCSSQTKKF